MFKYQASRENDYQSDIRQFDIGEYIKDRIKFQNNEVRLDWLVHIDDIVLNPIFSDIDEILNTLDRIKSDYLKSLVMLRNISTSVTEISHSQAFTDYIFNKRLFSNSYHKVDINLKFCISKIILDLFSSFSKKTITPNLKDK
jgi:hypothetical protein